MLLHDVLLQASGALSLRQPLKAGRAVPACRKMPPSHFLISVCPVLRAPSHRPGPLLGHPWARRLHALPGARCCGTAGTHCAAQVHHKLPLCQPYPKYQLPNYQVLMRLLLCVAHVPALHAKWALSDSRLGLADLACYNLLLCI